MVSPELLRRYTFFAGFSMPQIVALAKLAEDIEVEAGHSFFEEGQQLDQLYLLIEGKVGIIVSLLEHGSRAVVPELASKEREVVVSTIGPGEGFAWSALVPPHEATSTARALSPCRVVAFDCVELRPQLEADPQFGYRMMQQINQVMRERLRAMRNESLAYGPA